MRCPLPVWSITQLLHKNCEWVYQINLTFLELCLTQNKFLFYLDFFLTYYKIAYQIGNSIELIQNNLLSKGHQILNDSLDLSVWFFQTHDYQRICPQGRDNGLFDSI